MDITKFIPYVYLHSKEKYQPISVDEYMATCTAYKYLQPRQSSDAYDEKNPIFPVTFEFLNSSNFEAFLDSKQDWEEYKYSTSVCYYATKLLEDGNTQLEFFFFLPANDGYTPCNCGSFCSKNEFLGYHKADWENFLLILSPQGRILKLYFSAHGSKDGYWKTPEECTFLNSRPVIYMALGAHGLYHRPDFWPRAVCVANDITDRGKMLDMEARPVGEWFFKRIDWRKGGTDTPTLTEENEIKQPYNTNFWKRMFCFC